VTAISLRDKPSDHYHGIVVYFEEDTSDKAVQSVIERYSPDDCFNNMPRYVRLTYLDKSEREVMELAGQISTKEEYVIYATYVSVSPAALDYPKENEV